MVPWIGGKGGPELNKFLFSNFDLKGITTYVEPFGGMYGIYFGDNDYSKIKRIVYNDIDNRNCNLFRCAKQPILFLLEINNAFKKGGLLYYKDLDNYEDIYLRFDQIYKDFQTEKRITPEIIGSEPNYESALIYAMRRLMVFKQLDIDTAIVKTELYETTYYKKYKMFQPLVNKLNDPIFVDKVNRLEIMNKDFVDVLNEFNSPDTFIYLDPPYFEHEQYYDVKTFGLDDHKKLSEMVNESNSRFAISYYYFEGIEDFYPKSKFTYLEKKVLAVSLKEKTELLIIKK